MSGTTYDRHVGDTGEVLAATLSGTADITGTTVTFKMVDEFGVDKIAETATGVAITDGPAREVEYTFSEAGVDTAGTYYGYFLVDGESHYPVVPEFKIVIHPDVP